MSDLCERSLLYVGCELRGRAETINRALLNLRRVLAHEMENVDGGASRYNPVVCDAPVNEGAAFTRRLKNSGGLNTPTDPIPARGWFIPIELLKSRICIPSRAGDERDNQDKGDYRS